MIRVARSLFFAILGFLITSTAARADELEERAVVKRQAEVAYRAGDFKSLEVQHERYGHFLEQRTSSGAFKMTLFFDGVENAKRGASEADLKKDIARTLAWVEADRTSTLANVLHAAALISYGEYFRGRGYANTVPPAAWKIFQQYMQEAGSFLLKGESAASHNTSWHACLLDIARSSNWPSDVVMRIYEDGLKRNPFDFRLYRNVELYLLPKWHGTPQLLDNFVRQAALKSPKELGSELYARLYSGAEQDQFHRSMYTESLVDWPKMKEGLELWVTRFPTTWNLNIFAYHACIAGDKATTRNLLSKIGEQPEITIWEPNARATFDTCAQWAASPDAPAASTPQGGTLINKRT